MLLTGTEQNAWNRRPRETYLAWCARYRTAARTETLSEGLTPGEAAALIEPLLAGEGRPDAVVVATSDFAALVADMAASKGLRVPSDLMIAALTDTEHSRAATPPITAMDLNHESLAEHAVELMLARLAGAAEPDEPLAIDPVLRFRGSTSGDRSV